MMSAPPDDDLADDDLDVTAKLPILSAADSVDAPPDVDDATGEYRTQPGATAAPRVEAAGHWDLADELVSVRDRIVSLEAALADTETKLAQLHARHDSLQSDHADLLNHSQGVSRDRDRLAEESLLLLASRQQLQDQLEQQRVESSTALRNLQQSLEHQHRTGGELQRQLTEQRAEAEQLRQQHARQISDLTRQLEEQRQHGAALHTELLTAQQQFTEQHASAAALARSMAQALLQKDDLQRSLLAREQRIAALEGRFSDTSAQLASAIANGESLLQSVATHQQEISERARQAAELQRDLKLAGERIAHLVSQVEVEKSHWRSAEQDNERLCQTVATDRETLENTRRELSERQAEIGALQDELNRAVIENGQLGQQLAERNASLNARQEVIARQDQELRVLQEAQAALVQREATLLDSVMLLREELGQAQGALQKRVELHVSDVRSLEAEREQRHQLSIEVGGLGEQLERLELQLRERDRLALEQARELDGVNSANQELTEQIRHHDQTVAVQAERIADLSATLQRLQDESARQDDLLQQARLELEAKHLEQGASARQVEALQVELHQHVEAMQAIRRDIHQVALQTRKDEGGKLLRTLTREDAEGVVHLLNKSSMSIGRGNECDIRLLSSSISRYHAVLRISHDAVIFEDMNSTNGCFVNGRRIKRQLLKDGDRLKVGAVPLRFGIRATQD
ncbi:MAG: FHA domain-containing protein [Steroidobacteraceae bacterium]